ncbi:MAG: hypothetical protein K9M56_01800 [Victivallales bacterium]|nr:hypothetical protein [Victivallales bacterium]
MFINRNNELKIREKLNSLFGKKGDRIYKRIELLLERHRNTAAAEHEPDKWVDEKDVFLITYGDNIRNDYDNPLKTLHDFLKNNAKDIIEFVHILPFYPFSSDDGFSVIDYFKVNPELGDWDDLNRMSKDFKLMFDAVINHISAQSEWFQGYLKGSPQYIDYFIETEYSTELSKVFRPRALPLLTEFDTSRGKKKVWTTFSEDQIDLNYKSEEVFLKILELLLFYIRMGAKAIRLDAIGFMWKEIGTSCIHLPQTHKAIQLFRDIFDIAAPETIIITETNVPHKENISYFGEGGNEAQMVYQFPLPPLVLFSMITGNAKYLMEWAAGLTLDSDRTTYFNFLASHDGIGVVPTHGILSDMERELMINHVKDNGGYVSCKIKEDGTEIPYELNINFFDAVSKKSESEEVNIDRFICSQAILLSQIGVPAIYIHSLLGSRNYTEGVNRTGRYRSINREKISEEDFKEQLNDFTSVRYRVFKRYKKLIKIRKKEKAFHPNSLQRTIRLDDRVFSIVRGAKDNCVIVLNNVSSDKVSLKINLQDIILSEGTYRDLISDVELSSRNSELFIILHPYQAVWLKHRN